MSLPAEFLVRGSLSLKKDTPTPKSRTRVLVASGTRTVFRRWHGMLPAILTLAVLSATWSGFTSLARGHWLNVAADLEYSFPLVVALADDVTFELAEHLADTLREQPYCRQVQTLTAEVLSNLLPEDAPWVSELGGVDLRAIPPTLQVVVSNGVRDPSVWEMTRRDLEGRELVEFVWPDGPDLSRARRRLRSSATFLDRGYWMSFVAVLTVWFVFLMVDLRHFVLLVGRDDSRNFLAESFALRRAAPTVLRALLVTLPAAALAVGLLYLSVALLEADMPDTTLDEAVRRAVVFAAIAGLAGHLVIGVLLWGHAHRPIGLDLKD